MRTTALIVLGIFILGAVFIYCGLEVSHCAMQFSAVECTGVNTLSSMSDHISGMMSTVLGILPALTILLSLVVLFTVSVSKEEILYFKNGLVFFDRDYIASPKMRLLFWLSIIRKNDPEDFSMAYVLIG